MERDDKTPATVEVNIPGELQEWQKKIVGFIVQYSMSAEHNFALTIKKGRSCLPSIQDQKFMVDRYLNGIIGLSVVLIHKFCRVDQAMEEVAVKALREKFAQLRSQLIKQALMDKNPKRSMPPVIGQGGP